MKNEPLRARPNKIRQRAKKIGVILPVLGLLGASFSAPRIARANPGNSFLETIGISIAVGTVLGASTLPFYDQPGKHLMNLAYGASAGAVTGIGILVYGWIAGPSQDEFSDASPAPRDSETCTGARDGGYRPFPARPHYAADVQHLHYETGPAIAWNDYVAPRSAAVYPAQFWTPVVSLSW
jgi:hypothetical protein